MCVFSDLLLLYKFCETLWWQLIYLQYGAEYCGFSEGFKFGEKSPGDFKLILDIVILN